MLTRKTLPERKYNIEIAQTFIKHVLFLEIKYAIEKTLPERKYNIEIGSNIYAANNIDIVVITYFMSFPQIKYVFRKYCMSKKS